MIETWGRPRGNLASPFLFANCKVTVDRSLSNVVEESKPVKPFWYQGVLVLASFLLIGFLALGSIFSAIRNALALVNPFTTYIGTILIIVVGISVHLYLSRHPLPWVTRGHEIRITRVGRAPILGFIGACVLLWVPRFVTDSKTSTFRQMALESTRGNLVRIDLRVRELHETVEQIGAKDAGARFRSLPDRLIAMGDLDTSFCRSLEFQMLDLEPEFARAGRAYCGTASHFSETEFHAWSTVQRNESAQDVLGNADRIEAQLALACLLEVPEAFYILQFEMISYSGEKMGLAEHDLLVGSRGLGLPDISIPKPYIGGYVRTRFRADCHTGKILR